MVGRTVGELWIPTEKAEFLFGRIGETARLGGAKVVLHKGGAGVLQKLSLLGTEEEIGRAACQVLVNIWPEANDDDADHKAVWCYEPAGKKQEGPFPWSKIEAWVIAGDFRHGPSKRLRSDLRMEHTGAKCRLELWLALAMHKVVVPQMSDSQAGPLAMEEDLPLVEATEQVLRTTREHFQLELTDMEIDAELAVLGPVPMDIVVEGAPHLFVIVDTNILLTHWSWLDRMFAVLESQDMRQLLDFNGIPAFNIVVVVPYMVMVELDYIKDRKKGPEGDLSKFAAAAIRSLDAEKDRDELRFVGESFSDFKEARQAFGDPDLKPGNDDRIIFCVKALTSRIPDEGSVHDAAILLSRDTNLRLKAHQHEVRAMEPKELPKTAEGLLGICFPIVNVPPPPAPPRAPAPVSAEDTGTRPPPLSTEAQHAMADAAAPTAAGIMRSRFAGESTIESASSGGPVGDPVAQSQLHGRRSTDSMGRSGSVSLNRSLPNRDHQLRVAQHMNGGGGDGSLHEGDALGELFQNVVEGPLAVIFTYCTQSALQDVWEDVLADKPPWTANKLLDLFDRQFMAVFSKHPCVSNERALQDAVKGKNTPLRELVWLLGRGQLSAAHRLLTPAADSLVTLIAQFVAPRNPKDEPGEGVPKRVTTQEFLDAVAQGRAMAANIAAGCRSSLPRRPSMNESGNTPRSGAGSPSPVRSPDFRRRISGGPPDVTAGHPGTAHPSRMSGAPRPYLSTLNAALERFNLMPGEVPAGAGMLGSMGNPALCVPGGQPHVIRGGYRRERTVIGMSGGIHGLSPSLFAAGGPGLTAGLPAGMLAEQYAAAAPHMMQYRPGGVHGMVPPGMTMGLQAGIGMNGQPMPLHMGPRGMANGMERAASSHLGGGALDLGTSSHRAPAHSAGSMRMASGMPSHMAHAAAINGMERAMSSHLGPNGLADPVERAMSSQAISSGLNRAHDLARSSHMGPASASSGMERTMSSHVGPTGAAGRMEKAESAQLLPSAPPAPGLGRSMSPGNILDNGDGTDSAEASTTNGLQRKLEKLRTCLEATYTSAMEDMEETGRAATTQWLAAACQEGVQCIGQVHGSYQAAVEQQDLAAVASALQALDMVLSHTISLLSDSPADTTRLSSSQLKEYHAYLESSGETLTTMVVLMDNILQQVEVVPSSQPA